MPLFALFCLDKPEASEIRQTNREAHRAYVIETGVVEQAGPLLDNDGSMIGSLIILDVETRIDAEKWAQNDPYARARLFESATIHPWDRMEG